MRKLCIIFLLVTIIISCNRNYNNNIDNHISDTLNVVDTIEIIEQPKNDTMPYNFDGIVFDKLWSFEKQLLDKYNDYKRVNISSGPPYSVSYEPKTGFDITMPRIYVKTDIDTVVTEVIIFENENQYRKYDKYVIQYGEPSIIDTFTNVHIYVFDKPEHGIYLLLEEFKTGNTYSSTLTFMKK